MLSASDQLAIIDLYAAYNRTADAGDAHGWAETFTGEGVFHHPARDYSGAAELRSFIDHRTAGFPTSPFIDQQHWNDPVALDGDGDTATGSCRLLIAGIGRETGEAALVARGLYNDRLVRGPHGWRFAERTLTVG